MLYKGEYFVLDKNTQKVWHSLSCHWSLLRHLTHAECSSLPNTCDNATHHSAAHIIVLLVNRMPSKEDRNLIKNIHLIGHTARKLMEELTKT